MIIRFNPLLKIAVTIAFMLVAILITVPSTAQAKKSKKDKKKEADEPGYAYETFSTAQPKEKKRGFAGDEAKFQFEKPLRPVPYGKIDRVADYSKAPYFGHKRPPIRRPPGSMRLCKVCGIKH